MSLSKACQELRIGCKLSWSCPGLSQPVFNGFVMNANTALPFTLQWSRPARVRVTFPAGTLSPTPRLGKAQGSTAAGMGTRRSAGAGGIFPALGAGAGLGHKSELAPDKGDARAQPVLQGCGTATGKEGELWGLCEVRGFGTDPALLWLSAEAASLGCKGAVKEELKPEKDGVRLVHSRKDKVKRCLRPTAHLTAREYLFYSLDLFPHLYPWYTWFMTNNYTINSMLDVTGTPLQGHRGSRAALGFGGMQELAPALATAGLSSTHPWRAGREGAVPLRMAFLGCLKCQVHLDALTTGTTH